MKRTALATLALGVGPHMFAGVGPARAQQRLGAVVCVTSELETLGGSGPVRRVIRKDVELVYRVGFTLADLEEVEQSLEKELGPGGETWCARSDPEHSHVVVVSYQGVVREDLTIDPGDPRFQSFAVGYGASWEEAERNATMLNDRFATNNDGSGYEVLVRERWGVEDAARAGGDVRATAEEVEEVRPVERPPPLEPEREQPVTGPSTVFRDCSACPKMVVLPAGVFTMGSPNTEEGRFDREGPRHSVRIESPLAVGVYEVTFAEWDACVRARGCEGYRPADEGWGRGRRPVINVSWEDAQGYVSWVSRETGESYRLLSEAEWEHAARGGTTTARYWGEGVEGQCLHANGFDQSAAQTQRGRLSMALDESMRPVSCSDGYANNAPVGSYVPNAFGLYDVLGNVWEWTEDCWNENYRGAPPDGSAWEAGDCSRRLMRGGYRNAVPKALRSAQRSWVLAGNRVNFIGFRVARTMN